MKRFLSILIIFLLVFPMFTVISLAEDEDTWSKVKDEVSDYPQLYYYLGTNSEKWNNLGICYNFFLEMGATPEASAAICSNLVHESAMRSNALESGASMARAMDLDAGVGIGLAQWTDRTRKGNFLQAAQDAGVSWEDKQFQLEYIWYEVSEGQGSWYRGDKFHIYGSGLYPNVSNDLAKWDLPPSPPAFESFEDYISTTNWKAATTVFTCEWERPAVFNEGRVTGTEEILKLVEKGYLKGVLSEVQRNIVTSAATLVKEGELEGVISKIDWSSQQQVLIFANDEQLSKEEAFSVWSIKDKIDKSDESNRESLVKTILTVLGVIIIMLGVLLLVFHIGASADVPVCRRILKFIGWDRAANAEGISKLVVFCCLVVCIIGVLLASGSALRFARRLVMLFRV